MGLTVLLLNLQPCKRAGRSLALEGPHQLRGRMPGAAPELPAHAPGQQPLTAEQFRVWKQQQDAQAAQACICSLLRASCSQALLRREDQVLTIGAVQAKAAEAQQRREDILAGRVLPNGAPCACLQKRGRGARECRCHSLRGRTQVGSCTSCTQSCLKTTEGAGAARAA